jgi:hypothetical protein
MIRVTRQIGIISLHCTLVEIGPKADIGQLPTNLDL